MPPTQHPFGGDGPLLMGVSWTLGTLGLLAVVLRHHHASKTPNGKWRWDYIWACLTAKCALLAIVLLTIAAAHGLGNDIWKISYSDLRNVIFWTFLALTAGVIAIIFAKLSVIALLLQIEDGLARKRRFALFTIAGLFTISNLLVIPANYTRCFPARKIWDPIIEGHCDIRFSRYMGMSQSYITGATDLALALWPISIVVQMNSHSLKTKIKIVALMSVATTPGIFGFLRAKQLQQPNIITNFPRRFSEFMLFGSLELGLIVILTSIPVLASQFERMWDKAIPRRARHSVPPAPVLRSIGPDDMAPAPLRYHNQTLEALSTSRGNDTKGNTAELSNVEIDKTLVSNGFNTECSPNSELRNSRPRQSFFSDTLSAIAQAMRTDEGFSASHSSQV
ncbi:hypothetical protein K461DRAFT_316786 [Myriangium duriaei CBS 260.36]|uniref:Rhodopsin domain-containing protein n=1 Tax=Myriangium duriaei CBS 260.36 TaxID=1168546 RepID=A0A9P4J724_9PEZI|nr:hypothetical protein K461DRAFT_316786 [Myriangium duriaei CBS 260.36]